MFQKIAIFTKLNETKWCKIVQFKEIGKKAKMTFCWLNFLCLPKLIMSGYLSLWYLPTCMMSVERCDVCPIVWCLFNYMMSAYLCDVCSILWCLPSCMMSSYLYDDCLTVSVGLSVLCLLNCMTSAHLYDVALCCDVCLPVVYGCCCTVWWLPTFMMSAQLSSKIKLEKNALKNCEKLFLEFP